MRLIWQEKPFVVAMVTKLKEGSKTKCEQYWPNTQTEPVEIGPFTITLADELVLPDYVVRNLTVKVYLCNCCNYFYLDIIRLRMVLIKYIM